MMLHRAVLAMLFCTSFVEGSDFPGVNNLLMDKVWGTLRKGVKGTVETVKAAAGDISDEAMDKMVVDMLRSNVKSTRTIPILSSDEAFQQQMASGGAEAAAQEAASDDEALKEVLANPETTQALHELQSAVKMFPPVGRRLIATAMPSMGGLYRSMANRAPQDPSKLNMVQLFQEEFKKIPQFSFVSLPLQDFNQAAIPAVVEQPAPDGQLSMAEMKAVLENGVEALADVPGPLSVAELQDVLKTGFEALREEVPAITKLEAEHSNSFSDEALQGMVTNVLKQNMKAVALMRMRPAKGAKPGDVDKDVNEAFQAYMSKADMAKMQDLVNIGRALVNRSPMKVGSNATEETIQNEIMKTTRAKVLALFRGKGIKVKVSA